jgi:hypothetical protein
LNRCIAEQHRLPVEQVADRTDDRATRLALDVLTAIEDQAGVSPEAATPDERLKGSDNSATLRRQEMWRKKSEPSGGLGESCDLPQRLRVERAKPPAAPVGADDEIGDRRRARVKLRDLGVALTAAAAMDGDQHHAVLAGRASADLHDAARR